MRWFLSTLLATSAASAVVSFIAAWFDASPFHIGFSGGFVTGAGVIILLIPDLIAAREKREGHL